MNNIVPQDTPQKQCTKCKKLFPPTTEFFHRHKQQKSGLSPRCKLCIKASYEANKEQILQYHQERREHETEYMRQYRQTEKNKAYSKKWNEQYNKEHKEQIRTQQNQYYQDNWEEIRKKRNEFGRTEQGRLIYRAHKHKRRAQKKASGGSYTPQQLQEQMKRQKSKCYYCKVKLGKIYHADHIVPLARGGSNDISNIVIACPTCNMRKNDKLPSEWFEGGRLL